MSFTVLLDSYIAASAQMEAEKRLAAPEVAVRQVAPESEPPQALPLATHISQQFARVIAGFSISQDEMERTVEENRVKWKGLL